MYIRPRSLPAQSSKRRTEREDRAPAVRRGFKRAIIACAYKMRRTIHAMLRKGEAYRDTTVDLEALNVNRNAPRWIKALIQYGRLPATAATR